MKFGTQIEESNSDEEVKQSSTTDIEQAERDEQSFLREQRLNYKNMG